MDELIWFEIAYASAITCIAFILHWPSCLNICLQNQNVRKCLPLASVSEENSTIAQSATNAESTIRRPVSLAIMLRDDDYTISLHDFYSITAYTSVSSRPANPKSRQLSDCHRWWVHLFRFSNLIYLITRNMKTQL